MLVVKALDDHVSEIVPVPHDALLCRHRHAIVWVYSVRQRNKGKTALAVGPESSASVACVAERCTCREVLATGRGILFRNSVPAESS